MNIIDTTYTAALLFDSEHPPPSTAYDDPTMDIVYHGERRDTLGQWLQSRALLVYALPCERELYTYNFRRDLEQPVNSDLAEKLISLIRIRVPLTESLSQLFYDHLLPFCEQDRRFNTILNRFINLAMRYQRIPYASGLAVEETEWSNDLEHAVKRALLATLSLGRRLDHPCYSVYPDLDDRVPFDYSLFQMGMGLMQSDGAADFGFGQAWAVHKSMLRSHVDNSSEQRFTHIIVDAALYATHTDPRIAQNPDSHVLLNYCNDITLVPTLLVERVKNGASARRAHLHHLAIAMKSALAVYRRLGLSSMPVLGLLVENKFVRLIMGVPSAIAPEWLPWHAGSKTTYDNILEPISTPTTFRIVNAFEWFRIYAIIKNQHRRVLARLAELTAPKRFKLSWRMPSDVPRDAICTWLPCADKPTTHFAYRSKDMNNWLESRRMEYFNCSSAGELPSNVQEALCSLLDVQYPQWILRAGRGQKHDCTASMPGDTEIRTLMELISACEKAELSYDAQLDCPTERSRGHVICAVCLAADASALRDRDGESPRQDWAVVFNHFMDNLWADMWREEKINRSDVEFHIAFNQRFHTHRSVSPTDGESSGEESPHSTITPDGAASPASSAPQYITPDVVFLVLVGGPFSFAAAGDIDRSRETAWETEFSAEQSDDGSWFIVRIPLLIVEYVKADGDCETDPRGHLAMTMKSTLAVHRMYSMPEEVVFGLLVDRQTVTLSIAWDSQEGGYSNAKDYVCFGPVQTAIFDICKPLDALRLRSVLLNLRAKGARMVKQCKGQQLAKILSPFTGQDVPDSIRWKQEYVSDKGGQNAGLGGDNIANWSAAVSDAVDREA